MTDEQVVHELRQQLKAVSEALSAAAEKDRHRRSRLRLRVRRVVAIRCAAKHLVQSTSRFATSTYANE
jgi:hypothetical protein